MNHKLNPEQAATLAVQDPVGRSGSTELATETSPPSRETTAFSAKTPAQPAGEALPFPPPDAVLPPLAAADGEVPVADAPLSDLRRLKELAEAVDVLLTFASRNAVKSTDMDDASFKKLVSRLIAGRNQVRIGVLNADQEAEFIEDFRRLARVVQPVTVRSIRDSVAEERGTNIWFFPQLPMWSRASSAIARFTVVSIVALLSLLYFQILWVSGVTLTQQIENLSNPVGEVVEARAVDGTTAATPAPAAVKQNPPSPNPPTPSAPASDAALLDTLRPADVVNRLQPIALPPKAAEDADANGAQQLNKNVQLQAALKLLKEGSSGFIMGEG